MLVWLENPEVFPAWVDARKKTKQHDWPETDVTQSEPRP